MQKLTIGILALQGDVIEHIHAVERLGAEAIAVKYPAELDKIDGLIIPGGESTCIDRLTDNLARSLFSKIKKKAKAGMPVYGTCMGSILLAKSIEGHKQRTLGLMDITIRRNAYGSQKLSFETEICIKELGNIPFEAVFIRAPSIIAVDKNVEVLAMVDDSIVMARQNNFLATTFHPELLEDTRIHRLFLDMVEKSKNPDLMKVS